MSFNPDAAEFVMPGMHQAEHDTQVGSTDIADVESTVENLALQEVILSAPVAEAAPEAQLIDDNVIPAVVETVPHSDEMPVKAKSIRHHDGRDHINVVFIGHVDAGKSTISGNILYLSGQVDERTIQKYEREAKAHNRDSWYLAFIMDTNEEERAKGKTVEVGRAPFETKSKRYTILDAPGHAKFVPNMISGAAQADVGVLVISARKGEFEAGFKRDGQTREHVQLAKTVGISRLIVAINKMDEKTVLWSKERFDQCIEELTPFLKKWGFNEGKNLWFTPISGLTGAGLKDRVTTEMCPWYNGGPSLLDLLDLIPVVERDATGPVRIPVVDKYKDMGSLFIVGKVENGTLVPGKYVISPSETPVTVSSIFIDDDEVESARPGENVQLMIKDCEEDVVHRGQVLCSASSICHASNKFEAIIAVTDLLEHSPLMTAGYQCVLHLHCLVLECQIVKLVELIVKGPKKGASKPPAFVKVGANVRCVITVDHPIALETYEDHPQLGRFTLRDEGKTVAIGKITRIGKMK